MKALTIDVFENLPNLDKIGQIWIQNWIILDAPKPLILLDFSTKC